MAEHIGRRLESFETVHHRDGNKLNNDIKNLELWASIHPAGQRVSELVKYAEEILLRYGDIKEEL